jgi:hypothetical protein
MRRTLQLLTLAFAASLATACAEGTVDDIDLERRDPATLTWVAPTIDQELIAGDVVTLTVSTANTDAHRIDFTVDGASVGSCDADDPMSDCREENLWSISTTFDSAGTHTLAATFHTSTGRVVTQSREVTVMPASTETPADPGSSGMEMDPMVGMSGDPTLEPGDPSLYPDIPEEPGTEEPDPGTEELSPEEGLEEAPEEVGDLAPSFAATRGYLDPSKSFHNIFRGRRWALRGQRILLRRGRLSGDVYRVAQCMQNYGEQIARYADLSYISRASLVALMIAETNCTNPAPRAGAVRAGPLAIRASVCSALNPTLNHQDCLLRMSLQPSAGIETAVRYLRSGTMRRMHHNDPIKLAAAFHTGGLRRTSANSWHLVSPRGYLTRFAQAYNAYRSWEALGMPLPSAM